MSYYVLDFGGKLCPRDMYFQESGLVYEWNQNRSFIYHFLLLVRGGKTETHFKLEHISPFASNSRFGKYTLTTLV